MGLDKDGSIGFVATTTGPTDIGGISHPCATPINSNCCQIIPIWVGKKEIVVVKFTAFSVDWSGNDRWVRVLILYHSSFYSRSITGHSI